MLNILVFRFLCVLYPSLFYPHPHSFFQHMRTVVLSCFCLLLVRVSLNAVSDLLEAVGLEFVMVFAVCVSSFSHPSSV